MRSSIVLAGAFALTMAGAAGAQQPPPVDTPSTDRSAGPSSSSQSTDWTAQKPTTGSRTGASSAGSHSSDAAACETGDRTAGRDGHAGKDCAPAKTGKSGDAKSRSSTTRDTAPTTTPKPSNSTPPM